MNTSKGDKVNKIRGRERRGEREKWREREGERGVKSERKRERERQTAQGIDYAECPLLARFISVQAKRA